MIYITLSSTNTVFLLINNTFTINKAEKILSINSSEEQVVEAAKLIQLLIIATEPRTQSLLPSDLGASARIITAVVEVLENNNSTDQVLGG